MERNNKKKYVQIHIETSTNKIFTMLNEIDSDNESDIEYVAEEPVPETKKTVTTFSHQKLIFIWKVPPRVVILSHQRRN